VGLSGIQCEIRGSGASRIAPPFFFGLLTLALGIGANTAIFSVVNAVLLNAVPYYEPQRLVWVTEGHEGRDSVGGVRADNYLAWQAQSQAFEHLIAFSKKGDLRLTGQGEPEQLESLPITANVFPALGLAPSAKSRLQKQNLKFFS
jgi:putative ABC transport system permease protein